MKIHQLSPAHPVVIAVSDVLVVYRHCGHFCLYPKERYGWNANLNKRCCECAAVDRCLIVKQ